MIVFGPGGPADSDLGVGQSALLLLPPLPKSEMLLREREREKRLSELQKWQDEK